ncbi:DNA primase [uncultured Ruthenibacterium sp.]|uniref:DNA primase n=1 Tax=uncultured Ruthenibacterium sp. TaxID=1905347 RepID=UPI00259393A2|nr:DNA primase [uncultured Ruthenibacterium sp.]
MIPRDYITELVQRSDIVDVVQSYVQLRHRGRTHTGLCPFHNEKTPSFVVYPETQSFYCFGCGAGGDVITFIKKINNVDYIEAVKFLAGRAGMALPEEDDQTGRLRSRIISINKDAARFYFSRLNSDAGRVGRAYWRGRGLSDATIKRFGLGYAPDSFRETRDHLKSLGYTEDELLEAGLIKRSEKGGTFDFFRHRVMIPIFDLRGNVIAFSGRKLDPEQPGGKYVNSPETLVYKKSRTLFALNFAKKSQTRRYILCEGNLDAISMHQAGFTTAVAGCGTALTAEQVKILSEYADEVVLCYDSDEAGQKATRRAISLLSASPLKISVLNIPDAKDPDEFIKKFGAERFEMLLNGSNNAIEYELLQAKGKYDIATPDGRLNYIKDAIGVLAGRITPTERDVYAGRLAEETDVAKPAILNQLDAAIRARGRRAEKERERRLLEEGAGGRINVPYSQGGQKALGVAFAEQQLVAAILKNPDYIRLAAPRVSGGTFLDAGLGRAYTLLCEKGAKGEYLDLSALSEELPEETVSLISRVLAQNYDIGLSAQDVELYLDRIERSQPVSSTAGGRTAAELADYLQALKDKKT